MNIILTGATGLLGSYIIRCWGRSGSIRGIYLGNYNPPIDKKNVQYYTADVRDEKGLEGIFKGADIDVVIHAAGEARVDFCERNREIAYSSNVAGTKNVINLCKKYKVKLVYISTNAIFDGTKPPYKEDDAPNPINVYGRIKLECEKLVENQLNDFLIVRPILMYGWTRPDERPSISTWILEKLKNNEEIKLVDDIYDNPLYAGQCADIVFKLAMQNKKGIYHVAGGEITNRYKFGLVLAEVFGLNRDLIKAVPNGYFKDIAPRPRNTSYDTGKIVRELCVKPVSAREGLMEMKRELSHAGQRAAV
jgi:dTDP-4-dehydrorhamnose reductase